MDAPVQYATYWTITVSTGVPRHGIVFVPGIRVTSVRSGSPPT
ncbi:hypothetical protein [Rhodococcus koreensis]|nr:hypothetical protein [Rhodococcus koreensis]